MIKAMPMKQQGRTGGKLQYFSVAVQKLESGEIAIGLRMPVAGDKLQRTMTTGTPALAYLLLQPLNIS